jgi:SNF family Na+-dependent transporter
MGIAFGSVISFASYNRFNNQIVFDTFAVSLVNALTSLLVGIFAFATIGNIAWEQNTSVDNVVTDGTKLFIFANFVYSVCALNAFQGQVSFSLSTLKLWLKCLSRNSGQCSFSSCCSALVLIVK